MRRTSTSGLGGAVSLFTLLIIGGWALGSAAPYAAMVVGALLIITGLKAVFTNTIALGLMGMAGMGLGAFAIFLGIHLHNTGWGM
jgi:hypothetical protein